MTAPHQDSEPRHATAVAIDGAGVLIIGPSGSGKSALALDLISRGGVLIADDRCRIVLRDDWPWLREPERLAGVIEARGVGLLRVPHVAAAPLRLVVDMGEVSAERMPEPEVERVLGQEIVLVRRVDAAHFPGAIVALAKGGFRHDD